MEKILPESPGDYSRVFLVLKKNEKNEAHERSFHSKQICSNTKLQTGNSAKSQKFNSSRRLGIFIGSDGCLFACPNSSYISQISPVSLRDKIFQFRSQPFGLSMSPCVHSSHESNSIASSQESYYPFSISRQLVIKKSKLSSSVGTQTIHHSFDCKAGTYKQSREVRSDSISEIHFHTDGISHSPQHSQNSSRQNSGSVRDYQSFSSQNNSHSQIIPVSFGKSLPLGLVAMAKESSHRLLMGK